MNECEFKKRFDSQSYGHDFAIVDGLEVMVCNDLSKGKNKRIIQIDDAVKILDEARKDLDIRLDKMRRELQADPTWKDHYIGEELGDRTEEVKQDWLDYWFGKGDAEK